ncbi:glycosyltransferase [Nostoc sp. LEGE 06077]|uniref:glycosyltransferase n=1 Tax=Nostoc sp. LEGE 06077 TaxID=915325 RepID=UPI0018828F68|nr:glycosyltransferase [Nostoc sp. LEGE 06077]MBE9209867.1 glycosyltransferase [Nostoc sp. LEGE 06077]
MEKDSILNTSHLSIPFVSVLIPVFNDTERLIICLKALEKQTYPQELYEVVVIDNGSEESIKDAICPFKQVQATCEARPGSYAARNKGISIAKGKIIAFTDSDCIPTSDWIEKGVSNLLNTANCGLVAGRIDFFFKNTDRLTPVELYESIEFPFDQELNVKDKHFGVTANLFTFKHVIDKVGVFDEELKSGGDSQWGKRVFQAGYQQIYADDVCVKHPARNSYAQLYKRMARFIGGKHDLMMRQHPSRVEMTKDLLSNFIPPFRIFYRIWKNKKLDTIRKKKQFTAVVFFIRYVVIIEKIRLYFGGVSRRD